MGDPVSVNGKSWSVRQGFRGSGYPTRGVNVREPDDALQLAWATNRLAALLMNHEW